MSSIDTYFRMSVIDGALAVCAHKRSYPECTTEIAVRQLRNGPAGYASLDYSRAVQLGSAAGWDAIVIDGDRRTQLRATLLQLALRLRPFWARTAHLGRRRVLSVVGEDQWQCLDAAGLLVEPADEDVAKWWDTLAAASRAAEERRKLEIGREGEKRTIEYESKRLSAEGIPHEPKWVALDDNSQGYDVLSFDRVGSDDLQNKCIEVKACVYSPTHFLLTRNEWDFAEKHKAESAFHIWNLETEELKELRVEDMAKHIPTDHGNGRWENVAVVL